MSDEDIRRLAEQEVHKNMKLILSFQNMKLLNKKALDRVRASYIESSFNSDNIYGISDDELQDLCNDELDLEYELEYTRALVCDALFAGLRIGIKLSNKVRNNE